MYLFNERKNTDFNDLASLTVRNLFTLQSDKGFTYFYKK